MARLEALKRGIQHHSIRTTPVSFRAWVARANPRFQWYRHCLALADVLQRVADGKLRRVMIFEPPRHGKSELAARLFPAYYLSCHPRHWVGLASYGADLATDLAREAKTYYLAGGGNLRDDQRAAGNWRTAQGGGLWSAGAGGPITGRGGDLLVLDDPIKNAEEAASPLIRRRHQDWWQSTFRTRAEPCGAVVIIQTRWHTGDLSGWLLDREGSDATEHWHIVSLPALAEEPGEWPATCTIEPDWRAEGEPLCPERYDREALDRLRGSSGPYYWAALYQQRPSARGGGMFDRSWFQVLPALPAGSWQWVRYWDKAATAGGDGARTAGALLGRNSDRFLLASVVAGRWGATERERIILQTAQADQARYGRVVTWVEQEPGSGGKESAAATVRMLALAGLAGKADPVRGDKVLRAEPLAAAASVGNVDLLAGAWNEGFMAEAELFPAGALKDQVDAVAGAYNQLTARRGPMPVFGTVERPT
jgi:predicted phage terminase large subunit-like protein